MPRVFSTALLLLLLGATTIAFAITEGLKLEPSPITSVAVGQVFSPTCNCATNRATIRVRLRTADTLTLQIVDGRGTVVRTLLGPVRRRIVRAHWDGRDDGGQVVHDGRYRPRLHLSRAHRTIVLPNPIEVDTKPPSVTIVKVGPRVLPLGHRLGVRYRVSEPGRASVFLDGKRIVYGKSIRTSWKLYWYVSAYRPGVYRLTLRTRDVAGNLSRPSRAVQVRIPIRVVRRRIVTRVGGQVQVRLETDGRAYYWKLGSRSGFANRQVLTLPAPALPGRYVLVVREHGDRVAVPVIVR